MHVKIKPTPAVRSIVAAVLALSLSTAAHAAGQHKGGHGHGPDDKMNVGGHDHDHGLNIGRPGKASEVSRTIEIVMTDHRFSMETISVRKGETIRFTVENKGQVVHEFNIGTATMHAAHQKEMAMMFEHGMFEVDKIHHAKMNMDMGGGQMMKHDDPNSVLLEPGRSAEVIWTFSSNAKLEFACNVPGHYEAGMTGDIKIR